MVCPNLKAKEPSCKRDVSACPLVMKPLPTQKVMLITRDPSNVANLKQTISGKENPFFVKKILGIFFEGYTTNRFEHFAGLFERNIYWTHFAKCYPGKTSRGHKQPNEVCAEEYLNKEIEAVGPELLILVGGHAIEYVTGRKQLEAISRNDNEHKEVNGKQVRVISLTHPSGANGSKYNPKYKFKETIALIQDEIEKYC